MSNIKKTGLTRRTSGLMALEPRFMFDGAGVSTAVDTASGSDGQVLTDAKTSLPAVANQAEQLAQQKVLDFLQKASDKDIFTLFNGGKDAPDALWASRLAELRDVLGSGQSPVAIVAMDRASQFTAVAAFTENGPDGKPTIFVNPYWANLLDTQDLTQVMVEELGHWMDSLLNPGADTPGDEGEQLAGLLMPEGTNGGRTDASLSDSGWVVVDGLSYDVEFASFKFVNAYEMVYDLNNNTNTLGVVNGAIDTTERWADKEQNLHYFNATTSLGVVSISDGSNGQNFSGNDVSAIAVMVGNTTYYGWISRPIKAGGIVRGFYFWTDTRFTSLAAAQADGNQDGDSTVLNNRGFVFVVDQAWFNTQISAGSNYSINNLKDGNLGSVNVANVGSSSDRVDSALNGLMLPNSVTAIADVLSINEDSGPHTGNLLTNDSDPNGDSFTLTSYTISGMSGTQALGSTVTIANVGTINIASTGAYTFTPAANYNGSVPPITYTITDAYGATSTATFSISVAAVNDAPDAVNDTKTVVENTPVTDNVLSNDTDPESDTLSVTSFSIAGQTGPFAVGTAYAISGVGSFLISANGSYVFTPMTNYSGAVPVVTYTISDGHGGTDSATLTFTITAVNIAPVANPDNANGASYATAAGCVLISGVETDVTATTQTGNVLSNDTDPDVTLVPGTTHQITAVTSQTGSTWSGTTVTGLYGTLTIAANGAYTYTIDANNATVKALTSSQVLSEYFGYTMTEVGGSSPLSSSSTLRVDVHGRNNDPVAVNDQAFVQVANGSSPYDSTTGNVVANDTDLDGDNLTVSSISVVSSTYSPGTFTTNMNAFPSTLTATTQVAVGIFTSASATGASAATYSALASDVTISVSGNTVNSFSFADINAFQSFKDSHPLSAGQSYYVRLQNNTSYGYIEVGAVAAATTSSVTTNTVKAGTYGSLTISQNGNYSYSLTTNPGAGTFHDTFTYYITDGTCTSSATLNITIAGLTNLADRTIHVNEDNTLSNTLTDANSSAITISSFSIAGESGAFTLGSGYSIAGKGTLTLNSTGSYSFVPTANYFGVVPTITYTLADGSKAALNIIVDPVNDAPAGTDRTVSLTDKQAYTFSAADFGFTDPNDSPANSFLNVKITTLPTNGTLALNGVAVTALNSISVTDLNAGKLVFTPTQNLGSSPSTSFTFQVQDNGGTANSGVDLDQSPNTFTLNVSPVNDAPVNTLPASVITNSYSSVNFGSLTAVISTTDPDRLDSNFNAHTVVLNVTGGTLNFTAGAGVTIDQNGTGTVTLTSTDNDESHLQAVLATLVYTPTTTFSGIDTLTMTTTDHAGLKDIDAVAITVNADDRTLTVTGTTVNEASPYVQFQVGGVAGQWLTLTLGTTGTGTGHATLGTDFLPNLQYFNGTSWVDYTGGMVQIPTGDTLLVRTPVLQDQINEGAETLKLTATNQAGTAANGNSTIKDDGTGNIFDAANNTSTPTFTDPGVGSNPNTDAKVLDDDRQLTVNSIQVNEASPFGVFTVSGAANQWTQLSLAAGTATGNGIDFGASSGTGLQYWDGTAWATYTSGAYVRLDAGGKLLVRTPIVDDVPFEGAETFFLSAMNTGGTAAYGTGTILDDGTGTKYPDASLGAGPAPVTDNTNLNDDRTIDVVGGLIFNEASTYATFTVTGQAGYEINLTLGNGTGASATIAGFTVDYSVDGGTSWTTYSWNGTSGNRPMVPGSSTAGGNTGTVLIRVNITSEADTQYEGAETFTLTAQYATNAAVNDVDTDTIIDDGTGKIDSNGDGGPDEGGTKDNDTPPPVSTPEPDPITVTGGNYNEGSPRAVFTVNANAGQVLTLDVQDAAQTGKAPTGHHEGKPNDSLDNAHMYYSLDGGATWHLYTGPITAGNVPVLVAVDITNERDDVYEGEEQLKLVVTTSSGQSASGYSSIFDDGTGTVTQEITEQTTNNAGANDPTVVKDDDRPITVTGGNYNEDSPRAVFTVQAHPGQVLTLDVQDAAQAGKAPTGNHEGKPNDSLDNAPMYYSLDGGASWHLYTGPITAGNVPVLVAVDITNERDNVYEGEEQLKLVVTTSSGQGASGYSSIFDDGTGTVTKEITAQTTNNAGANDPTVVKDDDRPIAVTGGNYNEGSPRAVFTVKAQAGQVLTLDVQDSAQAGKAPTGNHEGKPNDSLDNAPMYYSLDGGVSWHLYTGPITAGNVPVLVAVDITNERDDVYEGEEQLKLVVTTSSGQSASGYSSIFDDGTGTVTKEITERTTNDTGANDPTVVKDDDRPIAVTGGNYNEGSPRAVFTVQAHPGQVLTLDVQDAAQAGKAPTGNHEGKPNDSLDNAPMYYSLDGGATWHLYTGPITAGNVPVLVAVDITNERDDVFEGEEQFKLVVTSAGKSASGYSSIFDDGTGTVTKEITERTTHDTGANDPTVVKDDDRPKLLAPLPPLSAPTAPAGQPAELAPPPPNAPPQQAFSSTLTPLAPALVPAEPPMSLGDAVTSGSGYQIPVNESAQPGLSLYQGVTDQFIQSTDVTSKISLPFDAFIHSNKDAVIKLEAKQVDDSKLPAWVQFDPSTGVFEVTPPKGFKGKIDLKVLARDDDGREAVAIFQLFIGEQTTKSPQSRDSFSDKLRMAGKRPITLVRELQVGHAVPARETVSLRVRAG